MLGKLGLNLEVATMDWASSITRRFKNGPPADGGWSIFQTSWAGTDHLNPAGHGFMRGNGKDAATAPSASRAKAASCRVFCSSVDWARGKGFRLKDSMR